MVKTGISYFVMGLIALFIFGCSPASQVAAPEIADEVIATGEYTGDYWPTKGWRTCEPKAVGMDAQKLKKAMAYAASPEFKTDGIAIIRNGHIIAETYFGFFEQNYSHVSFSMAKGFTSTLIGMAIDKGLVSGLDEKLCHYYENWDCENANDLRSRITIRHALTLTTGLKWFENWPKWDIENNDALKMGMSNDYVKYVSEQPGLHEPGQQTYYSTGDPMLLSQVIQKATGKNAFEFAKEHLFKPLNIKKVRWDEDDAGHTATSMGLYMPVREYAKLGFLFLNKGQWENQEIVSKQWAEKSLQTDPSVNMSDTYGYLWHINLAKKLKERGSLAATERIPADAFMAAGVLGQNIVVIPSKNLVIVKVATQQKIRMDLGKLIVMILEAEI